MTRIDKDNVAAMVTASQQGQTEAPKPAKKPTRPKQSSSTIGFEDFEKIDLRIVEIIAAEHVQGADKLLQLTLSLGDDGIKKVFSGIKHAYAPEDLVGKLTVMVANLEPRKMKFGMSEGMVLAAGPGGNDLWLLEPHEGAKPGMKVK